MFAEEIGGMARVMEPRVGEAEWGVLGIGGCGGC